MHSRRNSFPQCGKTQHSGPSLHGKLSMVCSFYIKEITSASPNSFVETVCNITDSSRSRWIKMYSERKPIIKCAGCVHFAPCNKYTIPHFPSCSLPETNLGGLQELGSSHSSFWQPASTGKLWLKSTESGKSQFMTFNPMTNLSDQE